jgi:H+/Cl- antiporter ClcA
LNDVFPTFAHKSFAEGIIIIKQSEFGRIEESPRSESKLEAMGVLVRSSRMSRNMVTAISMALLCLCGVGTVSAFVPSRNTNLNLNSAPSKKWRQAFSPNPESDRSIDRNGTQKDGNVGLMATGTDKDPKEWTTSLFPAPVLIPKAYGSAVDQLALVSEKDFVPQVYSQILAGMIGISSGIAIAGFKLSIEEIREYCYGGDFTDYFPQALVPALGGVAVALLSLFGPFPPGVRGMVGDVDRDSFNFYENTNVGEKNGPPIERYNPLQSLRKAFAAICTLGTGCSLGPEGPGVEIGIAISRLWMLAWPADFFSESTDVKRYAKRARRNRLLLSAGAAAGVSAGFNAPLAGVFFALEVVQAALPTLSIPAPPQNGVGSEDGEANTIIELQQESLSAVPGSITAILTASVLAALVARALLGNELALQLVECRIYSPLLELPLYLILGACSGLVAVVFSQTAKLAKSVSDGDAGPEWVRSSVGVLPAPFQPILGGLTCSAVGYVFPQILFFGYETLNSLLRNNDLSTELLLSLLAAKIFTTAVSAGSGLVGGILAPSLFLGGMVGGAFHNVVADLFQHLHLATMVKETIAAGPTFMVERIQILAGPTFELADVSAYAMVGAASVLASLFRAPLTASLLLFELTRNYDVLLPLLASAGLGSLIFDLMERKVEEVKLEAKISEARISEAKISEAKILETPKPPIEQKSGALDEKKLAALKSED